jgi:hypothetical protein
MTINTARNRQVNLDRSGARSRDRERPRSRGEGGGRSRGSGDPHPPRYSDAVKLPLKQQANLD